MKGKAIIPLVLGLCMGLIAVKFVINKLAEAQAGQSEVQIVSIVVANADINAFETITEDLVKLMEVVDSSLVPAQQRIAATEDIIGRVTAKAIPKDAPVFESMLAPEGTRAGLVGNIPPGYRAVSVRIDEVTGVAYQISPGDWVDVIVVMDVWNGKGRAKETIAEVILQHVQVLAIGRATSRTTEKDPYGSRTAKSATLLLTEDEVPKLHLAATRGKLTLSMRGNDERTSETGMVAGSDVFESERRGRIEPVNATQPPPPPSFAVVSPEPVPDPGTEDVPHGITIFRGGRKMDIERITFANSRSRSILELSSGATGKAEAMMRGTLKSGGSPTHARTSASLEPPPPLETEVPPDEPDEPNIDENPELDSD